MHLGGLGFPAHVRQGAARQNDGVSRFVISSGVPTLSSKWGLGFRGLGV